MSMFDVLRDFAPILLAIGMFFASIYIKAKGDKKLFVQMVKERVGWLIGDILAHAVSQISNEPMTVSTDALTALAKQEYKNIGALLPAEMAQLFYATWTEEKFVQDVINAWTNMSRRQTVAKLSVG